MKDLSMANLELALISALMQSGLEDAMLNSCTCDEGLPPEADLDFNADAVIDSAISEIQDTLDTTGLDVDHLEIRVTEDMDLNSFDKIFNAFPGVELRLSRTPVTKPAVNEFTTSDYEQELLKSLADSGVDENSTSKIAIDHTTVPANIDMEYVIDSVLDSYPGLTIVYMGEVFTYSSDDIEDAVADRMKLLVAEFGDKGPKHLQITGAHSKDPAYIIDLLSAIHSKYPSTGISLI